MDLKHSRAGWFSDLLGIGAVCLCLCGTALASTQRDDPLWQAGERATWESETRGAAALATLKDLAHAIENRSWSAETAPEYFIEGARCNRLRPELELLRDSAGLRVHRAPSASFGELDVEGSAFDALQAFFEPVAQGQDLRIAVKVVGVEPHDEATWSVDVLLQSSAQLGAARVQQNAEWRVGCTLIDGEGGVHLSSVRATTRP